METETVVAICSFLSAGLAAVRWLLGVYFAQATKLEKMREDREIILINTLQTEIDKVKKDISSHNYNMKQLEQRLGTFMSQVAGLQKGQQALEESTRSYTTTIGARLQDAESRILKLGETMILISKKTGTK